MRAIVYTQAGDPDVLSLVERPDPVPGPGEVAVRLHRAGVNPTDWKIRRGGGGGAPEGQAQVPGQDGAGIVTAAGEGVPNALQGLRVWVWEAGYERAEGTAQDIVLMPVSQVATLPDIASFDVGASLGIPFMTAHRCLTVTEDGPTRLGPGTLKGRTVLVAGGAGAVGNAAIQLARWSDATVLTTVSSPAKAQLAARAGADHVIDYRTQDVAAEVRRIAPHGVHTIVEVSPAANAAVDVAVLVTNGSIAVYANNGGADLDVPIRPNMVANARWQYVYIYTASHAAKLRGVEDISAAVLDGAIRVGDEAGLPLHHYPLERTADAHNAVEDGAIGKVLLDIA